MSEEQSSSSASSKHDSRRVRRSMFSPIHPMLGLSHELEVCIKTDLLRWVRSRHVLRRAPKNATPEASARAHTRVRKPVAVESGWNALRDRDASLRRVCKARCVEDYEVGGLPAGIEDEAHQPAIVLFDRTELRNEDEFSWIHLFRYHSAVPRRSRTPCSMASPMNQWCAAALGGVTGFGPLRR